MQERDNSGCSTIENGDKRMSQILNTEPAFLKMMGKQALFVLFDLCCIAFTEYGQY